MPPPPPPGFYRDGRVCGLDNRLFDNAIGLSFSVNYVFATPGGENEGHNAATFFAVNRSTLNEAGKKIRIYCGYSGFYAKKAVDFLCCRAKSV